MERPKTARGGETAGRIQQASLKAMRRALAVVRSSPISRPVARGALAVRPCRRPRRLRSQQLTGALDLAAALPP